MTSTYKNRYSPWDLRQMALAAQTTSLSRAHDLNVEAQRLTDQLFTSESRTKLVTQRSHEACRRDNPKPTMPATAKPYMGVKPEQETT